MTPSFALTLDHDGIALLHDSGIGWLLVGSAALEDPDMTVNLAALRADADTLSGGDPLRTKLVLPESQILYTQITASGSDDLADVRRVEQTLEGATPYRLDELVYDWVRADDQIHIAAVARETLQEAQGFAVQNRFNPVAFVAAPTEDLFPGEAFFGLTDIAADLLPPEETVERAQASVRRIGTVSRPILKPKSEEPPVAGDGPLDPPASSSDTTGGMGLGLGATLASLSDPADHSPQGTAAATQPFDGITSSPSQDSKALVEAVEQTEDPAAPYPEDAPLEAGSDEEDASPDVPSDRDSAEDDTAPVTHPETSISTFIAATARVAAADAGAGAEPVSPAPDAVQANDAAPESVRQAETPTDPPIVSPEPDIDVPLDAAQTPPIAQAGDADDEADFADGALPTFTSIRKARSEPPMTSNEKRQPGTERPTPRAPASQTEPPVTRARTPPPGAKPDAPSVGRQTLGHKPRDQRKPDEATPPPTKANVPDGPNRKRKARRHKKTEPVLVTSAVTAAADAPAAPKADSATSSAPANKVAVVAAPEARAPLSEADALTVFGARKAQKPVAGSRKLGLILTAALVVAIGLVALWAFAFNGPEDAALGTTPDPQVVEPAPQVATLAPSVRETPIAPLPAEPGEPAAQDIDPALPLTDAPEDAAPMQGLAGGPQGGFADVVGVTPTLPEPVVAPLDPDAARAAYAVSGIWQLAPEPGYLPEADLVDDVYIAAIDPTVQNNDAYALPDQDPFSDPTPTVPTLPSDTSDDTETGQPVDAGVPSETLSPGGVLVQTGRPFIVPPERPQDLEDTAAATVDDVDPTLSAKRPRNRPVDLVETTEKANLGGRSRDELGRLRPRAKPASLQDTDAELSAAARMADLETREGQDAAEADVGPTPEEAALAVDLASATGRAVKASPIPRLRPANMAQIADRARKRADAETARAEEQAAEAAGAAAARAASAAAARTAAASAAQTAAAAAAKEKKQRDAAEAAAAASAASAAPRAPAVSRSQRVKPTAPTPKSVARQATVKNAVALNRVSLIGVYGTSNQRRALVRLPSGRYVKVKVGDRLDGGRVAAIDQSQLRYSKGGRNVTLKMPKG